MRTGARPRRRRQDGEGLSARRYDGEAQTAHGRLGGLLRAGATGGRRQRHSNSRACVMKMAVTWNHDAHVLAFRRRERAKQAFDEPYWPVGRTIRWIVKRERARVALEKLGAD